MGFCWHSSIINPLKETLLDDDKLSRADFAYFVRIRLSLSLIVVRITLSWRTTSLIDSVDNSHVPADLDFDNLPDLETMLYYHNYSHAIEPGPKYYFLGDAIYLREIPLMHFVSGALRSSFPQLIVHMPVTPRGNKVIYLTRMFQRMMINLGLSPNPKNRCCHPSKTIPAIPIQSITPLSHVTNEIKEHFKSSHVEI
ncbi:hypothetical protein Cgig2_000899 [Carnegiea gigantea]|uniref:Uncharacterized protein n=1 Tax=Carnegiea gigantea TaxID=171969 RepID=A0A9Q1GL23_9CARY|nr:hypothetical protein Cgig2_000899 [Carnegiea gigantea]